MFVKNSLHQASTMGVGRGRGPHEFYTLYRYSR